MTAPTLDLHLRPATLAAVNTRTERHGEEDVPACDLTLEGILLKPKELDALLPHATAGLFTAEGTLPVPAFPQVKPLQLLQRFEGAQVTVAFGTTGDRTALVLHDVKLAKVRVEPLRGGESALAVQVQTPLPDRMQELLERLGHEVHVAITGGKPAVKPEAQGALPLPAPAEAA